MRPNSIPSHQEMATSITVASAATSGEAVGGVRLNDETLIALADVPAYLPLNRNGKRVDRSVPFRWAVKGLRGVRLEFLQVGNRRYTNLRCLQQFFERLTAAELQSEPSVEPGAAITEAECQVRKRLQGRSRKA